MQKKKLLLTNNSLEINLNPGGVIGIKGRAMDGDLNEFFRLTEDWIDSYLSNPADLTSIDFCLEYSSRSNSLIFFHWIRKITKVKQLNKRFIINWFYEEGDEDILEQGEYISSIVRVPFNFVEISDPFLSEYEPPKWSAPRSSVVA